MKSVQRYGTWGLTLVSAIALAVTIPQVQADDDEKKSTTIERRTTTETQSQNQYDYYPESEVYFVPEKRVYYWESDGSWQSGERVPAGVTLGKKVMIQESASEPWHEHDVIVKKYGGKTHKEKVTTEEKITTEEEKD